MIDPYCFKARFLRPIFEYIIIIGVGKFYISVNAINYEGDSGG